MKKSTTLHDRGLKNILPNFHRVTHDLVYGYNILSIDAPPLFKVKHFHDTRTYIPQLNT